MNLKVEGKGTNLERLYPGSSLEADAYVIFLLAKHGYSNIHILRYKVKLTNADKEIVENGMLYGNLSVLDCEDNY